jgi:hypothetical protein
MTTDHQIAMMYVAQEAVIIALPPSVRAIWPNVSNAAQQRGANVTAAIVGHSPADLRRAYGAAGR